MNSLIHIPAKLKLALFAAVALLISACQQPADRATPTTEVSLTDAQNQLLGSVNSAMTGLAPIADSKALEERLNLSKVRADSIAAPTTGAQGVTSAARLGFFCSGNKCICIGDDDCNDMFSGICRNPSTGGSCSGSGRSTVCTCSPRLRQ